MIRDSLYDRLYAQFKDSVWRGLAQQCRRIRAEVTQKESHDKAVRTLEPARKNSNAPQVLKIPAGRYGIQINLISSGSNLDKSKAAPQPPDP